MLFRRLARLPFLAVRQLRWRKGSWSKESDRDYHEQLYEAQDYDPFRPDYPGYITIRRFADLVEPLIPSAGTVLDVGCGPGEITCELARRYPRLSFLGIDHSTQAIQRAQRNASRLSLANVRFLVGDGEQLPPEDTFALVTMFDAFHHLERPREFLAWVKKRSSRCLFIEPAGTWSGSWARSLDLDWLLSDLANIRDRVEAVCGEPIVLDDEAAVIGPEQAGPERGEGAVERRYAIDDFVSFFSGWQLRITGTIAGFDHYPPRPHARSALRPLTGDIAYTMVRAIDDLLQQRDRDGVAKHWVVAATTEPHLLQPRLPNTSAVHVERVPARTVTSAFDVRYNGYDGPERVQPGAEFRATIEIRNAGWDTWRSAADNEPAVRVSYHWLSRDGEMIAFDGLRSDLPHPLAPGDTCRAFVAVKAPDEPGEYLLAFDLVKEGVTWFSEAGLPWHAVLVQIAAKRGRR